jgi:Flp pilus assembly protein TadD
MNQQQHEDRDAYVAFQEGSRLLADDNAHAAVVALERACALEPAQGSVREALARAYFRTGRFAQAEREFQAAVDIDPVNDYAHYGLGVCRLRAGDRLGARGPLKLATGMRPDNADYRRALAEASE